VNRRRQAGQQSERTRGDGDPCAPSQFQLNISKVWVKYPPDEHSTKSERSTGEWGQFTEWEQAPELTHHQQRTRAQQRHHTERDQDDSCEARRRHLSEFIA